MAAQQQDLSTLICLFHHIDHAHAALEDILKAGIPEANVTLIGDKGSNIEASGSTLTELNVPDRDIARLLEGIKDGGAVLSVSAISTDAEKVDAIFRSHSAAKIDEAEVADDLSAHALPPAPAALEDEDLVLITEDVFLIPDPAEGITELHVVTAEPIEPADPSPLDSFDENGTPDTDPRDLGFDPRMQPIVFSHQVD